MTNNNYILARWRDTTTDPPMSDWTGHAKTHEGIKFPARIVNGMIYMFGAHTSRVFPCQPGDQWLDITDVPAVPRAQVQAAVDDLVASEVPSDCECPTCDAIRAMCKAIGVTPTEEPQ